MLSYAVFEGQIIFHFMNMTCESLWHGFVQSEAVLLLDVIHLEFLLNL